MPTLTRRDRRAADEELELADVQVRRPEQDPVLVVLQEGLLRQHEPVAEVFGDVAVAAPDAELRVAPDLAGRT